MSQHGIRGNPITGHMSQHGGYEETPLQVTCHSMGDTRIQGSPITGHMSQCGGYEETPLQVTCCNISVKGNK